MVSTPLTINQVSAALGVTRMTLYRWRRDGTGPRWEMHDGHPVYPADALAEWIEGRYAPARRMLADIASAA